MKKIEKALVAMQDYNYNATIIKDKLYVTAWNMENSDSADFQVSKEDIDKWAADYDRERTERLLAEIRQDLNMIYETIDARNPNVYILEYHESFPLKTLLSNIDCHLDELQKLKK